MDSRFRAPLDGRIAAQRWLTIVNLRRSALMQSWLHVLLVVAVGVAASFAAAAEEAERPKVDIETVLTGLDRPSGIAVQPETGHIVISDSAALRVVKFDPGKPGETTDVITGFAAGADGPNVAAKSGPLALAFLDRDTLIVGSGGQQDGKSVLTLYSLPTDGSSITADSGQSIAVLLEGSKAVSGGVSILGLVVDTVSRTVYVTTSGDDQHNALLRSKIKDEEPSALVPFIDTRELSGVPGPVALAMHHEGYLVVGQMGSRDKPRDSRLTMYRPDRKKLVMNRETGLHDICALAYGPARRLYAADFAWLDHTQGGVYRLDALSAEGGSSIRATLVTTLDKPTATAFGRDDALYVTVAGTVAQGAAEKPGKLVRIRFTGGD